MTGPIPTLPGSATHQLAVLVFQDHQYADRGVCVRCGEPVPCAVRRHAASVIVAAGEDPRRYNQRPVASAPGEAYPDHTGYHLGGRGVPMDPAGFTYERDDP